MPFLDIRGYTTRSEHTRPLEMLALVNRWFDGVVGGTVGYFLNDAIKVAFRATQWTAIPSGDGWRDAQGILSISRA